MEFIRSQRGAAKLCYEGFTYTKKKETKSTMRWECSQRRTPHVFDQVFTVRVPLGETSGTVAYALLPSKDQTSYEECMTAVLDACLTRDIRPTPSKVVCDFEVAIHNAVRQVMANDIQIQSTWRRIQGDGLQVLYREDDEIRQFCGRLDGLALLPTDKVLEGMAILKDTAPAALTGIVDYFDTTYASGGFRSVRTADGMMRFRRTPPRFQLDIWNVHAATVSGEARTNNLCEAWNNAFQVLVGHQHPSLWTVVDCFMKDAAMVETEMYRVRNGEPSIKPKKKSTERYQRRLKTLCEQVASGEKSVFERCRRTCAIEVVFECLVYVRMHICLNVCMIVTVNVYMYVCMNVCMYV
ncbi:uncharacterized protein LOC127863853 [Dreissena polymorpha]|uniref:uncharacterized protein LOC127863853 n=1 Tax=Dreissena polymorpha TaxID=45954 RepID=UPI002264A63D|nr:uncharacterized protein LOC127863853 [Dreissena polymorpha]